MNFYQNLQTSVSIVTVRIQNLVYQQSIVNSFKHQFVERSPNKKLSIEIKSFRGSEE